MDEDPDQNDDLWIDIVTNDRILARDVEFFIHPGKDRPFDGVVSVDSAQQFRQIDPIGFSTTERAAAYIFTNKRDTGSIMVKTTIEELDRLSRPPG